MRSKFNISYILSKITELVFKKLPPSELIIVRLGRSIFYHFESFHYYFALLRNRIHLLLVVHNCRVESIVMKEDLLQSFHSNSFDTFDYCRYAISECPITQCNGLQIWKI